MKASYFFGTNLGPHNCYYCCANCDDRHKSSDFVKDTFTNRDIVAFPGSDFCCAGCIASLGNGEDSMIMLDRTIKTRENERGMQPRMYSWVLTVNERLAATKAHIEQIRNVLYEPPQPPFAIVLADSGQKQLLFRAPVAMDRDFFDLMLEDEIISVDRARLPEYVEKAKRLCAATGKPALRDALGMSAAIAVEKYYGELSALEDWAEIQNEPMAKLAAWVCPNKEVSQNEYRSIERGGIPPETGRAGRPEQEITGNGNGGYQGRDGQIPLFSPNVV